MIFMGDKKCQTAIFGQRRWHQTTTALSIPKATDRGRFVIPDGAKMEPYNYVESFDKAAIRHNTMLHCQETVADSKYSLFNPGWVSVISRECGEPDETLGSVSLVLEIGL